MEEPVALNAAGGEAVDANSESEKCYICLSPFEKQTVGSLDKCPHFFCFECIHQWSQTANTCPVDRISFSYILQRKCPEGDIQKKLKVTTRRKDDETEEDWRSVVICEECGRSGRRDRLLVCRHCDSGYHMDCLTPPLNSAPEGDWACPDCATTLQNSESFLAEEADISDGEITDLLSDMDQTPSTSSRLRASTVNRPSRVTERRRSARIQSRGGSSSPYPRPQTSWHVPKYLIRASRPSGTTEGSVNLPDVKSPSDKKKRKRRKNVA
ncbi:PREDICTED: PHD and RING finger domain-containing protein 1-like [Cyprinodon variegatus]|uniref:PHD and RING finger domain-containing protein 1-like n=1 Tax=Cyprinodon variegatus TaxID=28743 RepID=UPI000742CCA7|nr:PREDICTED: PHD and RING finger domain-containing protein 1-like [Cyprinodon variegatus]